MKFSAEQAFEAQEEGDPIMLEERAARALVADHDSDTFETFLADEFTGKGVLVPASFDAATVLGWLGY